MMDDETSWQDAAPASTDMPLIGPTRPDPAPRGADYDAAADGTDEYDELESGIASIFAAIQAAGDDEDGHNDADEANFDEAHTFQLLSELDRLWQRPSP